MCAAAACCLLSSFETTLPLSRRTVSEIQMLTPPRTRAPVVARASLCRCPHLWSGVMSYFSYVACEWKARPGRAALGWILLSCLNSQGFFLSAVFSLEPQSLTCRSGGHVTLAGYQPRSWLAVVRWPAWIPSIITELSFFPLQTLLLGLWNVCLIPWTCWRFMITVNLLYSLSEVALCSSE